MITFKEGLKNLKFNREEILLFLQTCINSYDGKHGKVINVLQDEKRISVNDVTIILGKYLDYDVICFRGTKGDDEWALDFNAEFAKPPFITNNNKIKTHLGFTVRYKTLNEWLKRYIKENNLKNILFLGHSLGASTAMLASDEIKQTYTYINTTVVTFGSPRIGNEEYVNFHFKSVPNTLNFRNKNDIVCRVPTEKMGYKHCPYYVWIAKPTFWQKLLHPINYFKGCKDDHRPTNYYENIKKEKIK